MSTMMLAQEFADRGSQYSPSATPSVWPRPAGIEQSVGSMGDSYALAESIIGLYKTEVIRPRGPWRGLERVEFATLEWVHWFVSAPETALLTCGEEGLLGTCQRL